MRIDPYLFLEGSCEAALTFYKAQLGAEITALMRYGEAPEPPPGVPADKIMHASFQVGETVVLASDGHCSGQPALTGFALTLSVPDVATADRLYGSLGEGGAVRMPIAETFFSPRFGIVVDRFGVTWMVMVEPPRQLMRTEIIDVAARRVAIVRGTVPFSGMPEAQREARRALAAAGAPVDQPLAVWWTPRDGMIDYAPGAVVPEDFETSGPVSLFTLPAGRVAHLTLRGGYEGLPGAWQTLFSECAALGVTSAGIHWEVYAAAGAVDPQTDLFALLT